MNGHEKRREVLITTLYGNLRGLKPAQKRLLENLYRRRMGKSEVFSPELMRQMCAVSRELGRRVGVLADRDGRITHVIVGEARSIAIPDLGRERISEARFRGLRLIQTNLGDLDTAPGDELNLAKNRLDLTASIAVLGDGGPGPIEIMTLMPPGGDEPFRRIESRNPDPSLFDLAGEMENLESEFGRKAPRSRDVAPGARSVLIGLSIGQEPSEPVIAEMRELARTAGVGILDVIWQRRREPDPRYVLGRGKLSEITVAAMRKEADTLLYALDLTPAQARSIEDMTGLRTIDRTQLILDIFAKRAKSRDGKLQVELAQLKYMLPRLSEKDSGLSRHTGGIGLKGPGETKLELSRRRTRERIARLEAGIDQISGQRELRRSGRRGKDIRVVSLVGYTNAGKSTLLNALTGSSVLVEDRLFATLDTTSRRLRIHGHGDVIMTDTVGFIRELPPDLIRAFRATLEELNDADILLHVVDAAADGFEARMEAVDSILSELGLADIPQVLVFNKMDLVDPAARRLLAGQHGAVAVSALRGEGFELLMERVAERLGNG